MQKVFFLSNNYCFLSSFYYLPNNIDSFVKNIKNFLLNVFDCCVVVSFLFTQFQSIFFFVKTQSLSLQRMNHRRSKVLSVYDERLGNFILIFFCGSFVWIRFHHLVNKQEQTLHWNSIFPSSFSLVRRIFLLWLPLVFCPIFFSFCKTFFWCAFLQFQFTKV